MSDGEEHFSFNSLNIWNFLVASGVRVKGKGAVCEETIFVPSGSVTDIDSLPAGWCHLFRHSEWLVKPESDVACFMSDFDTDFQ